MPKKRVRPICRVKSALTHFLIEHAHWQRTFRPRYEALWDYVVGKLLRVPVPGVRLDRMMVIAIPLDVAEQLDLDLSAFVDDPRIDEDEASPSESQATRERRPFYVGGVIPRDERPSDDDDDAPRVKVLVPLSPADPFLFTQNILRDLWEGAMDGQDIATRPRLVHRTIPVGQYKLAVIPTVRGRSAESVRAVLQGMQQGKQIEIFTPSARARNSASRAVIAIWIYQDASMAVVHLDNHHKERYILWHAPDAQQFNFDYVEELRHRLRHRQPGGSRPARPGPLPEVNFASPVWRRICVMSGKGRTSASMAVTSPRRSAFILLSARGSVGESPLSFFRNCRRVMGWKDTHCPGFDSPTKGRSGHAKHVHFVPQSSPGPA